MQIKGSFYRLGEAVRSTIAWFCLTLFCVYGVLTASVCEPLTCLIPEDQERALDPLGTEVTDSWELLRGCWEPQSSRRTASALNS